MASAQTMTSSSTFSSPFRVPCGDPQAFGSFTSCEGPPAKVHASPVAKLRKHVASALPTRDPKQDPVSLRDGPFDTEIVNVPLVPGSKPSTAAPILAPPVPCKSSKRPATSHSLDFVGPFDANILMLPFITNDLRNEPVRDRQVRRISSGASVASSHWSTAATSEDDMIISTMTLNRSQPNITAGNGEDPPPSAGQSGGQACRCRCGCAKYHAANTKLCKCACSCKSCGCKSSKFPKMLRMLESRGCARHHPNDGDPEGEKHVDGGRHERD